MMQNAAMPRIRSIPKRRFRTGAGAAVPAFGSAHVWMTLWKNPHPDKDIASLEVKGENEGVPGLISVSRGHAK